jgi:GTP-binding protein
MNPVVVAIDGPSGSGKSSTSRAIARRAHWSYLDTGALYRAITWLALEKNCEDENVLVDLAIENEISFKTDPLNPRVYVGGIDISEAIRSLRITDKVSEFARMPRIREYLLGLQQTLIASATNGIVVEGRDIGTVVAPDAPLKIFLYADIKARTDRRENEMQEKVSTEVVEKSLAGRDAIDMSRAVSPLRPAEDALEIDSTYLLLDEVVDVIWSWLGERNLLGLPKIAIIGRPNVGKSTLVNRIIGRREAIVEDTPGVTRDRVKYEAEWNGRRFILIDTGGWEVKPEGISQKITAGAELAIAEADLILFVVDVQIGALDEDDSLIRSFATKRQGSNSCSEQS